MTNYPLASTKEGMGTSVQAEDAPLGAGATRAEVQHRITDAYRAHAPRVGRLLSRLGIAGQDLEDTLQDVFVIVHRKLPEFEGRSSLKTWIYAIAIRVARRRRETRFRERMELERRADEAATARLEGATASAEEGNPQAYLERLEGMELFDAVISHLDDDKREIFILREVEQLTAPEISKITGVKLFTVYSRLRAANREVKRLLARWQLTHGEGMN